jgi:hypothetical protein
VIAVSRIDFAPDTATINQTFVVFASMNSILYDHFRCNSRISMNRGAFWYGLTSAGGVGEAGACLGFQV